MIRIKIWSFIKHKLFKIKEGDLIPWYGLVVKSVLFPISFLRYLITKKQVYDWTRDALILTDGMTISILALTFALYNREKRWLRFVRNPDTGYYEVEYGEE